MIHLFTDASYCHRTKVCGWAFLVVKDGEIYKTGYGYNIDVRGPETAECLAIEQGFKWLAERNGPETEIWLHSDSLIALSVTRWAIEGMYDFDQADKIKPDPESRNIVVDIWRNGGTRRIDLSPPQHLDYMRSSKRAIRRQLKKIDHFKYVELHHVFGHPDYEPTEKFARAQSGLNQECDYLARKTMQSWRFYLYGAK